jgi:hypothetical protein
MSKYRAYVNPVPSLSETAQRERIGSALGPDKKIAEWYVESRNVTRADFIKHLRDGDIAVVAYAACLAKDKGRKLERLADMADARGDIHAKGAILVEAATDLRSDKNWPAMKAAAIPMLGRMAQGSRSALNGRQGKPPLPYTNAERKTMMRIADSRRYKNWNQRAAAIKAEGIKVPGRTWFYNHIVSTLGATI